MKIYFLGSGCPYPSFSGYDGRYKTCIWVWLPGGQFFCEADISELVTRFQADICFPIVYGSGLVCRNELVILTGDDCPDQESQVREILGTEVSYKLFRGGIHNPHLPVRLYDAWPY